jgi:ribosomal protein S18 acetylase RimI-like enzyme
MEIANPDTLVVRPANQADVGRIMHLLRTATYTHSHADWHLPTDWIDTPGFVLCEDAAAEEPLLACLVVGADPLPAAWVRIAAVRDSGLTERVLPGMMAQAIAYLKAGGADQLAWLVVDEWPDRCLPLMGFEIINWITTYVKYELPAHNLCQDSSLDIRPAHQEEISALADIEARAFSPLWRHSLSSLQAAYRQSLSFDVVLSEGTLIGFQYSVPGQGRDSAHLVRMTIAPEMQGKGAGSALLAATLVGYQRLGVRRVSLNTQIDNVRSHHLYEKFNFHRIGDQLPVWALAI